MLWLILVGLVATPVLAQDDEGGEFRFTGERTLEEAASEPQPPAEAEQEPTVEHLPWFRYRESEEEEH